MKAYKSHMNLTQIVRKMEQLDRKQQHLSKTYSVYSKSNYIYSQDLLADEKEQKKVFGYTNKEAIQFFQFSDPTKTPDTHSQSIKTRAKTSIGTRTPLNKNPYPRKPKTSLKKHRWGNMTLEYWKIPQKQKTLVVSSPQKVSHFENLAETRSTFMRSFHDNLKQFEKKAAKAINKKCKRVVYEPVQAVSRSLCPRKSSQQQSPFLTMVETSEMNFMQLQIQMTSQIETLRQMALLMTLAPSFPVGRIKRKVSVSNWEPVSCLRMHEKELPKVFNLTLVHTQTLLTLHYREVTIENQTFLSSKDSEPIDLDQVIACLFKSHSTQYIHVVLWTDSRLIHTQFVTDRNLQIQQAFGNQFIVFGYFLKLFLSIDRYSVVGNIVTQVKIILRGLKIGQTDNQLRIINNFVNNFPEQVGYFYDSKKKLIGVKMKVLLQENMSKLIKWKEQDKLGKAIMLRSIVPSIKQQNFYI